jgi:hypothetical protein
MGESGKTLLTEPVLVVGQSAGYAYSISDREGEPIGSVRRVRRSMVRRLLRRISMSESDLQQHLHVLDVQGDVVLELARPSTSARSMSRLFVRDSNGNDVGQLVQQKIPGGAIFTLESGGTPCGSIVRLVAPHVADYGIRDVLGTEVARITETEFKSHVKALAKFVLTSADRYVVEIHRPVDEPLRSLVVAAALGVDLCLKQGDHQPSSWWDWF